MHLSIVIPAFNEEKLLPATLAAVKDAAIALTDRGISHGMIVCDNNSTDRTAEVAREHGADVVFEPVNQISRARNAGAASARGDWLLFLDADCTVSRGLFADLAEAMSDETVLYGGCSLHLDEPMHGARFFLSIWHRLAKWNHWAAGSFLFVRREAFEQSGGFSTELYASEELDLSRRLKRLAKQQRRRFVFLTAHPLLTSARKFRFHSTGWHLRFFLRTILCGTRNLRRRENCALWYDGRR
jgi:glycosyltransferase involved in cell wall biosynthesis